MGPFLRTPTPNNERPPRLSLKSILVAESIIAAAAAFTAIGNRWSAVAKRAEPRMMVGLANMVRVSCYDSTILYYVIGHARELLLSVRSARRDQAMDDIMAMHQRVSS